MREFQGSSWITHFHVSYLCVFVSGGPPHVARDILLSQEEKAQVLRGSSAAVSKASALLSSQEARALLDECPLFPGRQMWLCCIGDSGVQLSLEHQQVRFKETSGPLLLMMSRLPYTS